MYIDVIGYERQGSAVSSIKESLTEQKENTHNPRYWRFFGLFQKSFWFEFKNQFPVILNFGLACVIMCVLTNWFCSLIDVVFELADMATVIKFRQQDVAFKCFDYCIKNYGIDNNNNVVEALKECFTERPKQVFNKRYSENGYFNSCGYYLAYLGLDF